MGQLKQRLSHLFDFTYEKVNFTLEYKYELSNGEYVTGEKFFKFTKIIRDKAWYSPTEEMQDWQKSKVSEDIKKTVCLC